MRAVIYDLDGTLVDSSGDLLAAANTCFRDLGLGDLLDARDAGTALNGGRAMLRLGLERATGHVDEELVNAQYQPLLRAYEAQIDHHTYFYPDVAETVAHLRAKGYVQAVCTNKPEKLARLLLTRLGAIDWFDALIGADTLATRKPDPAPLWAAIDRAGGDREKAILIGDSVTDRDTARAAGVPVVLVTFGPSGDDMAALEPDAMLSAYSDLPTLVNTLIG